MCPCPWLQDTFAFSYLRHPHGLQTLEWRPPALQTVRRHSAPQLRTPCLPVSATVGVEPRPVKSTVRRPARPPPAQALGGTDGCNVLLTLCRDGVARLWSPTQKPEPEPLRFHLCAFLPLAGLTTGHETADPSWPSASRSIQWLQWLQVGACGHRVAARGPTGARMPV